MTPNLQFVLRSHGGWHICPLQLLEAKPLLEEESSARLQLMGANLLV